MDLTMVKKAAYHDNKKRLDKIRRLFLKLMDRIANAQKGKTVCKS